MTTFEQKSKHITTQHFYSNIHPNSQNTKILTQKRTIPKKTTQQNPPHKKT